MRYSKQMGKYFDRLEKDCVVAHKIAKDARRKGYDPEDDVEVTLAKDMADRVVGLISVIAPQIKGKGVEKRITDLEKKYGVLDWRVAFTISEEIARQKYCKFKDEQEAIEVGIRVGFSYVTLGVVSSPLEGFTSLDIKARRDGQGKYFCLNYSGPVRNAGGTAAAASVLIADYIRKKFGYAKYDPDEKEVKRCAAELEDYHEYITNLQYFPSKEESEFLMHNMPIEIAGDPSEKRELSNVNLKDLQRIETNRLRSGYCLIHSSCIPLKAPKLWKPLSKWGKNFNMEDWFFLEDFLKIQKKAKAQGADKKEEQGISPDFTYIKDLPAGRPILSHPLKKGGFRLRYGRSRASGYSGQCVHPATMQVLKNYIAVVTQLKVERPGKATTYTPCDVIDGPIVRLKNGSVVYLATEALAKQYKKDVEEIIFLGDVLVNYGDFFDRAHPLVPPGYCEEFWILELEKACVKMFGTFDLEKLADLVNIDVDKLNILFKRPLKTKISTNIALALASSTSTPLHPKHTFYWSGISNDELINLLTWLKSAKIHEKKIILPKNDAKTVLESAGIPHLFVNNEFVVLEDDIAKDLLLNLGITKLSDIENKISYLKKNNTANSLQTINMLSPFKIRDKSGTFIGARMGRPEKAKMRKLTGSPHVLFPVGNEGGKMRSFQAALENGKVTSNFPIFFCKSCNQETVLPICETCDKKTVKKFYCTTCGVVDEKGCTHDKAAYRTRSIDIRSYFNAILKKMDTKLMPDLIKGVRGTSNLDHTPEHLLKGILRAKHKVHVNKDGTIRYDISEAVLTHFKPKEIFVSIQKLREMGYEMDVYGKPLVNDNQVLELKAQDIVLPSCPASPDEPADEVLFRTTKFIDELLVTFYGLKPFYDLQNKECLIGHYVVGLAPHTSAGILGRIIGFSKTQGFLAHPLFHAAMRRDVDGDESCVFLLMDAFLNFSRKYLPASRGSTMDAPLVLTYFLNPAEVDDMAFNVDIVWNYPLALYEAAMNFKMPWDIKLKLVNDVLETPLQYEGYGFTHDTDNINSGVLCSAYKLLPTMQDKLDGQMELAGIIRAVDQTDVARLVIEKHFIKDTKGNLRKFSSQQFRCVNCNDKYRRPPLSGICLSCGGKIIFTISQGSVAKYLDLSLNLAEEYNVSTYLKQSLELTKRRFEDVFGKEKEKQEALGRWVA